LERRINHIRAVNIDVHALIVVLIYGIEGLGKSRLIRLAALP